ncbi:MAG: molybdopterin converting factor subunit 1 [Alphaproteobacteria bacterium]|nr:molybdopterin converting factor subunit 1 [Alphaproteobacteria bacterium]
MDQPFNRIRLRYFARARVQMGRGGDEFEVSGSVASLGELIAHLQESSPQHRELFASQTNLKFAVNHRFADLAQPIAAGDEVAIFPPVTGG